MSRTLKYAEDCIFLDAARRKLLETGNECLKAAWILQRRIRSMYGHVLPASAYQALTEQRAKTDWLIAALEDFKEYMEEERAWAPTDRGRAEKPDGRDDPDGPVADHVDGYRLRPGEE